MSRDILTKHNFQRVPKENVTTHDALIESVVTAQNKRACSSRLNRANTSFGSRVKDVLNTTATTATLAGVAIAVTNFFKNRQSVMKSLKEEGRRGTPEQYNAIISDISQIKEDDSVNDAEQGDASLSSGDLL